jgi:BNR repeat-like domain
MKSAVLKLVAVLSLALTGLAWAAPAQFTQPKRLGAMKGDQWEPALASDGAGRVYVLYPQYGPVTGCEKCIAPTMLLLASSDNGKSWTEPHTMLEASTGQFDAQIAVDPVDHRTVYAAWLQNRRRDIVVARSSDGGATWVIAVAARSEFELDKPALAVRGQNVYVGFNHEEQVWIAASADGGRSFAPVRVNGRERSGWALLGGAVTDASGNLYLAWSSYSQAGGARGPVKLYVSHSADGGKTWAEHLLDVSNAAPGCEKEECGEGYLGAQIALATDAGGTLYAAWSAGGPRIAAQDVYFSSSTNFAESWLPRTALSAAAPGVDHAFPAIVAGAAGDVRVAWMDARNKPYWNTYYRSSSNGGATWSPESRLSAYAPGYRYISKKGFRFPFGDYFGMTIDNHQDTHVVWGEGLNYQSPGSIWYATGK